MSETPILSTAQTVEVTPEGTGRTYTVAPLTFREKVAYEAELSALAGIYPGKELLLGMLRQVVRDTSPGNADELLGWIDRAEAAPEDTEAQARLGLIEVQASRVPAYAELLAARTRRMALLPWVAARHALRGWDGPGLPEFRREGGVVPEALMDLIPSAEVAAVGWRAFALLTPGPSAVGNSAPPSPSPTSPTPAAAASNRRKGGGGSSRGKSGSATPG